MKTIATINFKGGVGKTTVTWCLGDVLSTSSSSNVLLFDLDAQGSLTQSVAIQSSRNVDRNFDSFRKESVNIYDAAKQFLEAKSEFNFDVAGNFIYEFNDNYHFVPSVDELYWLELQQFEQGKQFFIKKLLGQIENNENLPKYDYVLFDCPPSFTFLSYSVLTCCDLILIPTNPDFFAAKGVDILLRVLKQKIQPHPLPAVAVFTNRVRESRKKLSSGGWGMGPTYDEQGWIADIKSVCDAARTEQGIDVHYMNNYIRHRVAVMRAITNRKTPNEHVNEVKNLWNQTGGKLR